MPNDKTQALRYLLLRHLWRMRPHTDAKTHMEVATSLTVTRSGDVYVVKWTKFGLPFEKNYPAAMFKFFVRGDDVRIEHGNIESRDLNDDHAEQFAQEALGIEKKPNDSKKESLFDVTPLTLLTYVCFAAVWYWFGDHDVWVRPVILLYLFACEFWFVFGKLIVPPLLLALGLAQLPFTAVVGLLGFTLMQLADPNKKILKARLLLSSVILAIALIHATRQAMSLTWDLWVILITVASAAMFVADWVAGIHTRIFPLVFPFLAIGLYLDGSIQLAVAHLCCALVGAIITQKGYHIFPTQKDKRLVSNG